jgi:hypothetical protein
VTEKPYVTRVWVEEDGATMAQVKFAFPGLGNTPEAESMKYRGLRSAKRALRRSIDHNARYVIVANKIDSLNRLHELTVRAERTETK